MNLKRKYSHKRTRKGKWIGVRVSHVIGFPKPSELPGYYIASSALNWTDWPINNFY